MSGTSSAVDLASLGGTPPSAPPTGTDVILIGRPGANGLPMVPYASNLSQIAASIASINLPVVYVNAAGTNQATATALQAGKVNIITGGAGGVALPPTAQGCIVMNQTANAVQVYPPLNPNYPTYLNGQAAGVASPLPAGVEVTPRTQDGLSWYVGA